MVLVFCFKKFPQTGVWINFLKQKTTDINVGGFDS